jgi:VIT1/CCC1 family predicted Fe2+/Mn2+ transporter
MTRAKKSSKKKGGVAAPSVETPEVEETTDATGAEEVESEEADLEDESEVDTETDETDEPAGDQGPETQRQPSAPPPAGSQPPPPPPKPPSVPPPPPEPTPKKVRDLGGEYECLCRVSLGDGAHKFPGEKLTLSNEQARHYLNLKAVKPLD